jgi:hypothetical protein
VEIYLTYILSSNLLRYPFPKIIPTLSLFVDKYKCVTHNKASRPKEDRMATQKEGVEGDLGGKPLSSEAKQKIQDVLKTTLQHELSAHKPTAGAAVGSRHGSVTHGSVTLAEAVHK